MRAYYGATAIKSAVSNPDIDNNKDQQSLSPIANYITTATMLYVMKDKIRI